MKTKVLSLLRTSRDYISGQELCKQFGVSRTAIWKVINQLKEDGYEIDAVTNKGYKLKSYPDILNKHEIASRMQTKWAGREVVFLEETGSTNVEARILAERDFPHGTLVVADSQTGGKGRRGRSWHTPKGSSIAMSIMLKPELEAEYASMLTLVQAMAVAKAIEEICGLEAQIKWPNDILVNEKKVCGILTEMNLEMTEISSIIIGTGINVNQENFPEEISEIATSLKIEKKRTQSRADLIERICELFEEYFEMFIASKDLSGFLEEYNSHLISMGRVVKVLDPKGEFTGEALGINALGELLVKRESGEVVNVYAGEVSVRGIYGYV